jgi:hypothetical protein
MAVELNKFKKIVALVIDKLEGGYYHPDMLADGRIKDSRYSTSGETMFGIDRLNGGDINTSAAGRQFWQIIDNANARKNWKWLYRGGDLEPKLRDLAGEMIYDKYNKWSNLRLTEEARQIVDSDSRLIFHFVYATWNGSGWFKKFATDINNAVERGIKDRDKLVEIALNSRINEGLAQGSKPNSLVAQGGKKISTWINDVPQIVGDGISTIKENPIIFTVLTTLFVVASYILYTNLNK